MNPWIKRASAISGGVVVVAVAFLYGAVPLSAGAAPGAGAPGAKATIDIDNFAFKAQTLTVAAGTEVTWINHDEAPHKVVSTDKKFSSPVLDTGARFSYSFATPGTYPYYCSLHPMMTGKVIVK